MNSETPIVRRGARCKRRQCPAQIVKGAAAAVVLTAGLLLAGCAISVGVTNSPDWCGNTNSGAKCQ